MSAPAGVDQFPRVRTGNTQADEVLGGGFPSNSINIVMGQPGTGKTIFAEQLLFANANDGDRPLMFITTLSEPLSKAVSYVQRFGFYDEEKLGTQIQYHDIGEVLVADGPSALVPWLSAAIKESSPRIVVIDSFRAIHDISPRRVHDRRRRSLPRVRRRRRHRRAGPQPARHAR
jgi:circadian clock protein KaiC